ncbi:hypothetical protein ES707_06733 [subsurface metagenome]
MNLWPLIGSLINRIPIERVLFPPRDNAKALEGFATGLPSPVAQNKAPPEQQATPTITQERETATQQEDIATACVPCAVGHFSTSAGLLNEAFRFKGEGITSNEILDRIAKSLEEQNTLERADLTQEKIQNSPPWEREIAEDALSQSRSLRHRLENLRNIEQLGQAAADSERVYKKLFREWFKQRFAHLGPEKAQSIADEVGKLSPEDKERVLKRAEELVEEA